MTSLDVMNDQMLQVKHAKDSKSHVKSYEHDQDKTYLKKFLDDVKFDESRKREIFDKFARDIKESNDRKIISNQKLAQQEKGNKKAEKRATVVSKRKHLASHWTSRFLAALTSHYTNSRKDLCILAGLQCGIFSGLLVCTVWQSRVSQVRTHVGRKEQALTKEAAQNVANSVLKKGNQQFYNKHNMN
eukprot:scpid95412/ scgid20939/ 